MEGLNSNTDVLLDLDAELLKFREGFWKELNSLKQRFGKQVLRTVEKWDKKDRNEQERTDKALWITQWIDELGLAGKFNAEFLDKLTSEEQTLLWNLQNSFRWNILKEKLNDAGDREKIYNLLQKIEQLINKK